MQAVTSKNTNWTMSLDRSLPLQLPCLSNIKGKLNFSAAKSPSLLKRFSLADRNIVSRINGSPFNNHLGDYHMSKQNPDVLDQLYSPPSSTTTPKKDHSLHKKHLTPSEITRFTPSPTMVLANRNGRTPLQSSLLRQTLNNYPTNSSSSLVHLATRGSGLQHMMNGISRSPVTVRLSGVTSDGMSGVYEDGRDVSHDQSHDQSNNPCDKNVVMSALRQKRKRWATSAPGDDGSNCLSPSGAPQAKRVRHSTQNNTPAAQMNVPNRKRSQTTPSLPAFKRTKVTNDLVNLTKLTNKVVIPEIECETESESGASVETGSQGSTTTDAGWSTESVAGSEPVWRRSMTPPTPLDETEMNKKRDESLNALKAVFPAPNTDDKKPSLRRKLPIFCATGSKPYLPTPLSVTHTVTQDDLKKDRAATAAKLKQILTAEDDKAASPPPAVAVVSAAPLNVPNSTMTTLSSTVKPLASIKLGAVSTGVGNGPTSLTVSASSVPASITTASAGVSQTSTTGLAGLVQTQQTKTVSFAPLPSSSSSQTTQLAISTPSATLPAQPATLPGLSLTQTLAQDQSKQGFQFPPVSVPSSSSGQLKLGVPTTSTAGLNLSTLQAPSTTASNLTLSTLQPPAGGLATLQSSTNAASHAVNTASLQVPSAVSTGGLSLGTLQQPSTTTGGLSLGTLQQPSTTSGGLSLGTLQQPSTTSGGLSLGTLQQPSTTSFSTGGLNFSSLNPQAASTGGLIFGYVAPTTAVSQSQFTKPASGFSLSSNLQFGQSDGSLFGAAVPPPNSTSQTQVGMFTQSKPSSSSIFNITPSSSTQQPSLSQALLSNPSANNNTSSFPQPQQASISNGGSTTNGKAVSTDFALNLSKTNNMFGNNSSLATGNAMNHAAPSSQTSNTGGMMFGGNTQSSSIFGTQQQQPQQTAMNGSTGSGFSFNSPTPGKSSQAATNSGFNFSAGAAGGLPGLQSGTSATQSPGLSLFSAGSTNTQKTQQQSTLPNFSFGQQQPKSNGGQQTSLFRGNQPPTAGSNGFSFALNTTNQQQLQTPKQNGLTGAGGIFSTGLQQLQSPKQNGLTGAGGIFGTNSGLQQNQTQNGISFPSGGMGMGQSMFSAGTGGQLQTSGLNFSGQNQNGSSGFNFSASTGLELGNTPSGNSGFNFSGKTMGVNYGNQSQTGTSSLNNSTTFNFGGCQTPQQQTSGVGFGLQTPTNQQHMTTPVFNVGTSSRLMAKPRRRKK